VAAETTREITKQLILAESMSKQATQKFLEARQCSLKMMMRLSATRRVRFQADRAVWIWKEKNREERHAREKQELLQAALEQGSMTSRHTEDENQVLLVELEASKREVMVLETRLENYENQLHDHREEMEAAIQAANSEMHAARSLTPGHTPMNDADFYTPALRQGEDSASVARLNREIEIVTKQLIEVEEDRVRLDETYVDLTNAHAELQDEHDRLLNRYDVLSTDHLLLKTAHENYKLDHRSPSRSSSSAEITVLMAQLSESEDLNYELRNQLKGGWQVKQRLAARCFEKASDTQPIIISLTVTTTLTLSMTRLGLSPLCAPLVS